MKAWVDGQQMASNLGHLLEAAPFVPTERKTRTEQLPPCALRTVHTVS
jgi:hypothetical protein